MNKKGETFGCLLGMLAAGVFTLGLLICVFSRFLCIELDYTDEQRNACGTKADFMLLFGFLVIIGSTAVMFASAKIFGFFAKNSGKIE